MLIRWASPLVPLALSLVGLVGLGCSRDLRDEIQEHKARVEAKLEQIKALREAAIAEPFVTSEAPSPLDPKPAVPAGDYIITHASNAAVVYLEDLNKLDEFGNIPYRMDGTGSVNRCASTLSTHREPYDPILEKNPPDAVSAYKAKDYFEHCEALTYLYVIRSLAMTAPGVVEDVSGKCPNEPESIPGADAGIALGATCKRFQGGKLKAEVLIFDIAKKQKVGAFRFSAENSSRIDVSLYSEQKNAAGPDLRQQIRLAFLAAARNVTPTFDTGH